MSADTKTLLGLTILFLGLAGAFWLDLWGRPGLPAPLPPVDPEFTNTTTVRLSAAELFRTDGDTSGLACYTCHDPKKPVTVRLDGDGNVILPEAHQDLVMAHGRHNRNNHCFNCHDARNLEMLRPHEGQSFKVTESSRFCGTCHGPTYRDWELGIHGRLSGYWDRQRGEVIRQDCTSCHDPHAPAFPSMKPGPAPRRFDPRGSGGARELHPPHSPDTEAGANLLRAGQASSRSGSGGKPDLLSQNREEH